MRIIREFFITLLIAIVIFLGLQLSIKSFEVFNVSMLPTYREGDLIIVNKLAYAFGNTPSRQDEIVFYAPGNGAKPSFDLFFTQHPSCFIKRVIGLPGDTVEIRNKQVYVNGVALREPYLNEAPNYTMPPQQIPSGQYFVLGDNRNHSNDSHTGWLVPSENIIGKVWFRYWPAGYPDIRYVMVPVFILVIAALIIIMFIDVARNTRNKAS